MYMLFAVSKITQKMLLNYSEKLSETIMIDIAKNSLFSTVKFTEIFSKWELFLLCLGFCGCMDECSVCVCLKENESEKEREREREWDRYLVS